MTVTQSDQSDAQSGTRTVDGRPVPPAGTYALDPVHTTVGFIARHLVVAKTRGRFGEFTGTVTIGEDPLQSAVEVDVQTASIDTRDEGRDTHLRSDDFFASDEHPTMTYRSTGVAPRADGSWQLDGDLTIRGVTRPVALVVEFDGTVADPWGGERVGFTAKGEVDREDFGLTWNVALETGGVVVSKKIVLEIEAEAVRQQ